MPPRLAAGLFRFSLSWRKVEDSLAAPAPEGAPAAPCRLRLPTIAAAAEAARLVSINGGDAGEPEDLDFAAVAFFPPDLAGACAGAVAAPEVAAAAAFFAAGAFFGAGAAASVFFEAAGGALSVESFFAFAIERFSSGERRL